MTYREMKNVFVLTMAIMLLIIGVYNVIDEIIPKHKYTVDQYKFNDGSKITIDWNLYEDSEEYKNVRYYFGCINDGLDIINCYMTAEQWHKQIYEKELDNYEWSYEILTEWRW